MRKLILGLVATAALASPLALATSADAATVSGDNCQPVKAADAVTHIGYKYSPVKSSDGPTQWDTVNAEPNTFKWWDVKSKSVKYFRDGTKTSIITDSPAVAETLCDTSYTEDLPDVFDDTREFDGQTYAFTQVTKTFTNTTNSPYVIHVANADQQDGNQIWIERTVFDNWYHDVVIEPGQTKTLTFDVWYDVANYGADVPDELTLSFQVTKNFIWG